MANVAPICPECAELGHTSCYEAGRRAGREDAARLADETAEAILVAHQRHRGGCLCGWAELGKSFAAHQVAMLRMDGEFRCICDPNDLFDPPDPRPRAVAGCPAHRARRAAQRFIERNGAGQPINQPRTPLQGVGDNTEDRQREGAGES